MLEKSAVYTGILHERMEEDKKKLLAAQQAKKTKTENARTGKKRGRAQHRDDEDTQSKRLKGEHGESVPVDGEDHPVFEQPALVTGAKLKQYQLEGLQWMVSLDQNGISGILGESSLLPNTPLLTRYRVYSRRDGPWQGGIIA